MTVADPPLTPSITIQETVGGIQIHQQRPSMTPALIGRSAEDALEWVPRLLPICGVAQSVAGQRAVDAALSRVVPACRDDELETRLWFEQVAAMAWRMAVDWPDHLGEPRELEALAQLRKLTDPEAAARALGAFVPGFDPGMTLDEMTDWAREGQCSAARLVSASLDHCPAGDDGSGVFRCSRMQLRDVALAAFDAEPFEPLSPQVESPIEVGALATAVESLSRESGATSESLGWVPRRLLAMICDARTLSRGPGPGGNGNGDSAWPLGEKTGLGRAQTARGPVFHRVRIGADDRISDWRVLAPTDWHFSPSGPVVSAARDLDQNHVALALLILSYDPCAPWRLVGERFGSRVDRHA